MTRQQKLGLGAAAAIAALLYLASGGGSSTPSGQASGDLSDWTCQSLAPQVIAMSKGREPEILELNDLREIEHYSSYITCQASAEWSQGEGGLAEFGARKSDGGNVILSYKQL